MTSAIGPPNPKWKLPVYHHQDGKFCNILHEITVLPTSTANGRGTFICGPVKFRVGLVVEVNAHFDYIYTVFYVSGLCGMRLMFFFSSAAGMRHLMMLMTGAGIS